MSSLAQGQICPRKPPWHAAIFTAMTSASANSYQRSLACLAASSYRAIAKYQKIRSCDLDFLPTTLKFNRVLAVVKIHVRTKFRQAKCSGSWVIVVTEKQTNKRKNLATMLKPMLSSLPRTVIINERNGAKIRNCIVHPIQFFQILASFFLSNSWDVWTLLNRITMLR